jgi:hypothetical protein
MMSLSMEGRIDVYGVVSVSPSVMDGDESNFIDEIHHMSKIVFGL